MFVLLYQYIISFRLYFLYDVSYFVAFALPRFKKIHLGFCFIIGLDLLVVFRFCVTSFVPISVDFLVGVFFLPRFSLSLSLPCRVRPLRFCFVWVFVLYFEVWFCFCSFGFV